MAVISEIDRGELVSNMLAKEAQEIEMAYFFVTRKDHEAQSAWQIVTIYCKL